MEPKTNIKPKSRKGKYTADMPERLIKYFSKPQKDKRLRTLRNGQVLEINMPRVPTLIGFIDKQKISLQTLYNWRDKYPAFSDAMEEAIERQKTMYAELGLSGINDPSMSKYVLESIESSQERARARREKKGSGDGFNINITVSDGPVIEKSSDGANDE